MRSKSGETITETLVAVLIIALGLVLLVNMLTASKNLITKGIERFHENSAVKNDVESGSGAKIREGVVTFSDSTFSDGAVGSFS
jgi:predicted DNA repair protein MutK